MSYDGKDRPITGNPDADTLSIQGEPYRTKFTLKKARKVVITVPGPFQKTERR